MLRIQAINRYSHYRSQLKSEIRRVGEDIEESRRVYDRRAVGDGVRVSCNKRLPNLNFCNFNNFHLIPLK